ncbi:LacI family DNA-binding transcriptional regulator [Serpentinicella alkaliphila]|uniref:LacI family transcriptional regulator n=1 Tax=Serpentinicella alkaliphila TaxID=1734049 RepID=A0A4R2U2Q4_9FIRM|nr:LacI family DNA-binding transcriptional regulator [Serpentinicella alkaliphila]QUH26866.1 LacI family DNA-binding transcriptional regulator [Serpentinicella alkaliphila]TCQ08095.1 LacI family transcriptional regulator [Serpentinicella alkaliphila]
MVNIRDIAKIAGVSPSTVSRVLNKNSNVKDETRDHVLSVLESLDYVPKQKPQEIVKKRIGIIVPKFTAHDFEQHPTIYSIVTYFIDALSHLNYENSIVILDETIDSVSLQQYDGLLITGTGLQEEDLLISILQSKKIPSVFINRLISNKNISSVNIDDEHATYIATKHLIDLGHERIALINGNEQFRNSKLRLKGYKQALSNHNITLKPEYIRHGIFDEHSGYVLCKELLTLEDRPTAMTITSDTIALGAQRALKEANLSLPKDMAMVGFGDISIASQLQPSLTTIQIPTKDIGEEAASILAHLISKPILRCVQILADTRLIIRESCGFRSQ